MTKKETLEKIRAEIEAEPYVSKMEVLDIIDKYKVEADEKELEAYKNAWEQLTDTIKETAEWNNDDYYEGFWNFFTNYIKILEKEIKEKIGSEET